MNQLPQFRGISCFEISHHKQYHNFFVQVEQKGKKYTRSIQNHNITKQVADLYMKDKRNMETGVVPKNKRRGRPMFEVDSIMGTQGM